MLIRYDSRLQMLCKNYHSIGEEDLKKAGLTQREAIIFKMRFNKDCSTRASLKAIGKYFKVTAERIRQIESKALRKLRFYLEDENGKR